MLAAAIAATLPSRTEAAPDPTLAPLLSLGATVAPLAVTLGLWTGGRGIDEGIRFDLGITFLGVGAIVGPSVGQIYAQGGTDAWVTFILRAITGSIMLTGVGLALRADDAGARSAGQALAVVSGIPTGLLAIYDIVSASSSAIEAAQRRGHSAWRPPPPLHVGGFSLCSALLDQTCPAPAAPG